MPKPPPPEPVPCESAEGRHQAHYWIVTIVRIDGKLHDHHVCKRCGAEKDLLARSEFGKGVGWKAKSMK